MSATKQRKFAIQVKTTLLHQGRTIADLAQKIGRPRSSVSQAINKGCFPRIVKQVKAELGITEETTRREK